MNIDLQKLNYTDKIDIIYSLGVCKELTNFAVDDSAISPKIIESIKNHELVKKKDMITHNDGIAIKYGFNGETNTMIGYDINYTFLKNVKLYQ